MGGKHFSIVFCGGCNPRINRSDIAKAVSSQLVKQGYRVSYNQLDADYMVYLSGCSVGCAERRNVAAVPFTVVAGASVDSISFEESALAEEIIKRGRKHFE